MRHLWDFFVILSALVWILDSELTDILDIPYLSMHNSQFKPSFSDNQSISNQTCPQVASPFVKAQDFSAYKAEHIKHYSPSNVSNISAK